MSDAALREPGERVSAVGLVCGRSKCLARVEARFTDDAFDALVVGAGEWSVSAWLRLALREALDLPLDKVPAKASGSRGAFPGNRVQVVIDVGTATALRCAFPARHDRGAFVASVGSDRRIAATVNEWIEGERARLESK